jgi:hypothetical protein
VARGGIAHSTNAAYQHPAITELFFWPKQAIKVLDLDVQKMQSRE